MVGVLLQASSAAARDLPGGYGAALLQALLALAAVCILAWIVLRWSAQRGIGLAAGRRVEVLERVALDARHSLHLVRIGERVLLVGVGDGAAPNLLAELPASEVEIPEPRATRSFLEAWRARASRGSVASTGPEFNEEPAPSPDDRGNRSA